MRLFVVAVLIVVAFVSFSSACKCKTQTAKESFCQAQWVSHLRIKLRATKQPSPDRKGLNNIRYTVDHIETFKKPSNVSSLLPYIFTPSESPACGLVLDVGKEYLLAGRFLEDGSLHTVICGQVRPDDAGESNYENVLEWAKVPSSFPPKMKEMKC